LKLVSIIAHSLDPNLAIIKSNNNLNKYLCHPQAHLQPHYLWQQVQKTAKHLPYFIFLIRQPTLFQSFCNRADNAMPGSTEENSIFTKQLPLGEGFPRRSEEKPSALPN